MLTHDLNTDELSNLLVDNLYPDAEVRQVTDLKDGSYIVSLHSPETMTHAFVWEQQTNVVGFTIDRYERLMKEAAPSGYTPLFIVGTPDGIFEFNMGVIEPKFELYSDGDKPDVLAATLGLRKGNQLLEFYPEFATQEEYLDSLMSDAEPSVWDDGDNW